MALIDLGTRVLNIGDAPVAFDQFSFRDARAYLFNVTVSVPLPNNIFSNLSIRGVYTNAVNSGYYTHHLLTYPITVRPFVFLLPFSNLYDGNGDANIEMERLPFLSGGSDTAGPATVNLTYDDGADIRTWL